MQTNTTHTDNQETKPKERERIDIATVRARLADKHGATYWRSLEELADTEEFRDFLRDEFPQQMRPINGIVDRRQFLTLAGAGLALAGLSGCRFQPQRKVVTYVEQPEDMIPGIAMIYATTAGARGDGVGVLVTSREGRPIKLEGNPQHPASLGSLDSLTMSTMLNLYDPDRAGDTTNLGDVAQYTEFLDAALTTVAGQRDSQGAGIRILTETVYSPTLNAQLQDVLRRFPKAKWIQYEPVNRDNARAGAIAAFGQDVTPVYHFDQAERILSLDGDFLYSMPGNLRYAREYARLRRLRQNAIKPGDSTVPTQMEAQPAQMEQRNRLYVAETTPTITGSNADHRIAVRASDMEALAGYLAAKLNAPGATGGATLPRSVNAKWADEVAADLQGIGAGKALIVCGEQQSPTVHALCHAMNQALGAVGKTVDYIAPTEGTASYQLADLAQLASDMGAGQVQMLLILGGNPVYNAPADLKFAERLKSVTLPVHLSSYLNETSALCRWHVPESHFLEAWSDARAYDGTYSIVQPLIKPLYNSHSAHELLDTLFGQGRSEYDIVQSHWIDKYGGGATTPNTPEHHAQDKAWQRILHDGLVPDTAAKTVAVTFNGAGLSQIPNTQASNTGGLELVFRPDPKIWDGRYSNNGWLQELPNMLTKVSWDNVALFSPRTAERLGLKPEDLVRLSYKGGSVTAPAWVLPGQADDSVTVHLGYGRDKAGRVGNGVGFNAGLLRTTETPEHGTGLEITKLGGRFAIAETQHQSSMEERDPVRFTNIEEFRKRPDFLKTDKIQVEEVQNPPVEDSFYSDARETDHKWGVPEHKQDGYDGYGKYAWGMSVDQTACIGCNACVIACVAENNIPVIGKDEVQKGRIMHWIRIDRYWGARGGTQTLDNPQTFFQPLLCMQCENAPCEPVCPVAASIHSHEGLNMQVYNRCVGTKYCSNNCPYKVRHFNFYKYIAGQPGHAPGSYDNASLKLLTNPEVTLRGRGVMEKCTYCVQRINAARQTAKIQGREIRDQEILTACQQACPTQAIVFGDILMKQNMVAQLKAEPHDYSLLAELNVRPRTTYMPRVMNPNPRIEASSETAGDWAEHKEGHGEPSGPGETH